MSHGKPHTKTVVIDTNVLLADPNSLLSYPHADLVIPEPVLGELDKLKTARVDPDLRFRGREVSRLLFELSEEGSLIDGVELPDGGTLRVATLPEGGSLPDGLSLRQTDDKILATAYQVCAMHPECDITLVTNDLNMLLKAQTLGIPVERYGEGVEGGFARRFIIRPFQRYRVPLGILAIALAVFAAIIVIVTQTQPQVNGGTSALPTEFKQMLTSTQQTAYDALNTLQTNPDDPEALLAMGNTYFSLTEQARISNDAASQLRWAQPGIRYYQRYLTKATSDVDARADYATLLYYSGQTDRSIQEIGKVIEADPNHLNGNFNYGVVLLGGRQDLQGAMKQFERVIALTEGKRDEQSALVRQQAQHLVTQIKAQIEDSETETEGATL